MISSVLICVGDASGEIDYLEEILQNMKLTYTGNHFLLIEVYKNAIEAAAKCQDPERMTRIEAMAHEATRIADISHGPDHPFSEYVRGLLNELMIL